TVSNSIVGDYKRITSYKLLLQAGVEVGYEHFSGTINYPFKKFGYYTPDRLGPQYHLKATTIYGRINLGIGYRCRIKGNNVDILAGNMAQTPITSQQIYNANLETLLSGGSNYNFHQQAYFGKDYDAAFV